jgi:hypothetical protein
VRWACWAAFAAAVGLGSALGFAQDPPPSKPTQDEIDKAIDRGAECIRKQQAADGSWSMGPTDVASHRFKNQMGPQALGHTALMTLTLLHADIDPDDASIQRGLAYLEGRRAEYAHTYNCGLALMAFEAFVSKKLRKLRRAPADPTEPPPSTKSDLFRSLPEERRMFATELALKLAAGQLDDGSWTYAAGSGELGGMGTGVRSKPGGDFKPPAAPDIGGDLSNTQYALLGLRSAAEMGIAFDPEVWVKAIKCMLARQEKKFGGRIPAFPVPIASEQAWLVADQADRGSTKASKTRKDFTPRGWGYATAKARPEPYAAMTTIGVSCLAICKFYVRNLKEIGPSMRDRIDQAIEDGCAWLAVNFNALDNAPWKDPNTPYRRSQGKIDGYYMYGIERAGLLTGAERFGEHEWYARGARYLVDVQAQDGSWAAEMFYEPKSTISTAFAVLFLKRATQPIVIETGEGAPKK